MADQEQLPWVRWGIDDDGYLVSPTGTKICRLGDEGILWVWDRKRKVEQPLTLEAIRWAFREWRRRQTEGKG
jgi:hypothetical protein